MSQVTTAVFWSWEFDDRNQGLGFPQFDWGTFLPCVLVCLMLALGKSIIATRAWIWQQKYNLIEKKQVTALGKGAYLAD